MLLTDDQAASAKAMGANRADRETEASAENWRLITGDDDDVSAKRACRQPSGGAAAAAAVAASCKLCKKGRGECRHPGEAGHLPHTWGYPSGGAAVAASCRLCRIGRGQCRHKGEAGHLPAVPAV